ncbi:MAG TPA: cation:dicarboxylase symporter family transporter, partial [Candidatus Sulfotelmatobacter sp.]|nr:cation:dicarboxylase symporter family transporter [Candidatus Sulfotelmatobacter sp.]
MMAAHGGADAMPAPTRRPWYAKLYTQVLIAIVIGAALGVADPGLAAQMKPLGDAFIKAIRMVIAPLIFATVVVGIAKMGDMRRIAQVGVKSLVYFEIVSTAALVLGLIVANLYRPGAGMNV